MKSLTRTINLCLIPFICVLPAFGLAACTATEAADIAATGIEVAEDHLAELPDNLRAAAPYMEDDLEQLWNKIVSGIEIAAAEFGVSEPPHPLAECRAARMKLISGASLEEVVKNAIAELTTEDLRQMPVPDLGALNGVLPFEIDLSTCGENLAEVLNSLDIGQVSAVLRSEAGYHLIQLIDRNGGRVQLGHIVFEVDPAIAEPEEPPVEEPQVPDELKDALSRLAEAVENQ